MGLLMSIRVKWDDRVVGGWVAGVRLWVGVALVCGLVLCFGVGCQLAGYLANAFGQDEEAVKVLAQYRGLDDRSVAVLVAADERVLFEYPGVREAIGTELSREIAGYVPGVRVLDPRKVAEFEALNPYWSTWFYRDVLKGLKVERVVYVDLLRYQAHEPGNAEVWRGEAAANVGVAEAEAVGSSTLAYATTVQVYYPEDSRVGVIGSERATVDRATVMSLCVKVLNLFRDHEEMVGR
jgi:hypothetical protein